MKNTTIKPILKTWAKPDINNEYGIYLRLTKERKISYLSLGIKCSKKLWNNAASKVKNEHKQSIYLNSIIDQKVQEYRTNILSIMVEEKQLSVTELKAQVEKPLKYVPVGESLQRRIGQLFDSAKLGNMAVYKDLQNSLIHFSSSAKPKFNVDKLSFSMIDYSFLIAYETYLLANKNTPSGVSVKMRTLRALYNHAIKSGHANKENYPFDTYKPQQRLKSAPQHVALTKDHIQQIKDIPLIPFSTKFEAQQYFLFSYYALGINLTDIAKLKWSNVIGNKISFIRQKTGKRINLPMTENVKQILNYFSHDNNPHPDNYIFPILKINIHNTPTQIEDRIHKVNKRVNKALKLIAKELEIDINLHFYIARHTMASTLKRSGQSVTVIKEIMGHEDEKTTQIYLDSLDDDIFIDAANIL